MHVRKKQFEFTIQFSHMHLPINKFESAFIDNVVVTLTKDAIGLQRLIRTGSGFHRVAVDNLQLRDRGE